MSPDENIRLAAYKARDAADSVMARDHDEDAHFADLMMQPYQRGAVVEAIGINDYDPRDLWEEVGVNIAGYDGQTDAFMINVLRGVAHTGESDLPKHLHGRDIADQTGIPESTVTLLQYIICSAGRGNYGSNPMGCWYEHDDESFADYLAAWREMYMRSWCQLPPDFYATPWVQPVRPILMPMGGSL